MTLLSICQSVADETKGARPATIAGNSDPAAQQLLRLVNKVGVRVMQIYTWNILRKENAFTSPGGETLISAANMPSDFDRFVPETFWDRSSNNLLSGPVSPVEWNGLKVQTFSSQNKKFIYRGGNVLTQPVFDAGVNLAFEYVSNEWATDTTGATGKTKMTVDTDLTLFDEDMMIAIVKYEWLEDEGLPSGKAAMDAGDALDRLTGNDAATDNIAVTGDIFAQNTRHFEGSPKASRASYGGDF
jgi:hypothetical protein